jgi:catechol 2,3-dioxygenase-like lactoylglutathione lyase family enzyme
VKGRVGRKITKEKFVNKGIFVIHHVTAITSDPQRNIDFHANNLGLEFVRKYSAPGAMRAGFEYYRAFNEDAEQNKALVNQSKLQIPVLVLAAGFQHLDPLFDLEF